MRAEVYLIDSELNRYKGVDGEKERLLRSDSFNPDCSLNSGSKRWSRHGHPIAARPSDRGTAIRSRHGHPIAARSSDVRGGALCNRPMKRSAYHAINQRPIVMTC